MSPRILSEIWIYPVKSLGGIRLKSSRVQDKGLEYDRRWMLIDDAGRFMTQRQLNSMALIKLGFIGEGNMNSAGFRISYEDRSIDLLFSDAVIDAPIPSKIWNDDVITYEVSKKHSHWFSEQLGMSCRLVSFKEESPRPVDVRYKIHDEHVSLADGYPLLVIGQASLDDLNARLDSPVPMNRFRPNLVFTGGEPFEEDGWKEFSVGTGKFAGVKPCARCPIPTINQDTAEKGIEPLLTLSRYRKRDTGIYFGQNILVIKKSEIHEGDEIIAG